MTITRPALAALLLMPLFAGAAPGADPVPTGDPYRDGLADVVRKVAGFIKGENKNKDKPAVALGPIQREQKGAAPGGDAELRFVVQGLLKENQIEVALESKWAIAITYEPAAVPLGQGTTTRPGLRIVFTIYFNNGVKTHYEGDVKGIEPAVTVLGRSFDAGAERTTDNVAKAVILANESKPTVAVAGDKTRASEKSPYAVELVANDKPFALKNDGGFALAALPKGKDFLIRLTNDSPHYAAADVRIDGISALALNLETAGPNKGRPRFSHYIVPPKGTATVGWHVSADRMDALKLTAFPESVAASFDANKVGPRAITVLFSAAWAGKQPPEDEPKLSRSGDEPRIGRGTPGQITTKIADLTIGHPRAGVTIRYEENR